MFEKLIDLIAGLWEKLSPLEIVNAYQTAAIMRCGRFHRALAAGLHWKWPLIESVLTVETCVTTLRLPPQTLTTKDGAAVVVAAIVKYQVTNVQPYVTEIWDQRDVLADVAMGAVRQAVSDIDWQTLVAEPPERRVLELMRKEVNQYGFKLHRITFTDIGRMRSLRLIQQTAMDIAN
jgi:regulator of protease activity HflC (stomatin/prohibitin superfamily)